MIYIDFGNVQAAREGLLEQISILKGILDRLKNAERKIRNMVYTEQAVSYLQKSRQEIEIEISSLQTMAECLENILELYRKTEERITDVYDLEYVISPTETFRQSQIIVAPGCEGLFRVQ